MLRDREIRSLGTILIVEDEPAILHLLRHILERAGFEVILAEDGQQALARLAEARPDLVLCDMVMPGLDGYETLTAIRRDPRTRSLPVLAVSVRSQAEDIQRALEAGANSYITKPFQRLQLLEEIHRFLTAKGVP